MRFSSPLCSLIYLFTHTNFDLSTLSEYLVSVRKRVKVTFAERVKFTSIRAERQLKNTIPHGFGTFDHFRPEQKFLCILDAFLRQNVCIKLDGFFF